MTTYKQTVLDIKDYISLEIATIDHLLEKEDTSGIPIINKPALKIEKETLNDIADIIKENGQ